ncbi:hypothetical protein [Chryseobacterium kwangjuense]|uniref:hypothetical protein n=1 Tax=Chryseobacterium kwangjuense TaxID=267125 RepID=UPI001042707A|nr:hypothetical protein [Chryseobacterium kwangjuense]
MILSKDARAWIFKNFELTEEQAAYYNELHEDFNYYLGWQMASNVIGRQPITIEPIPAEASRASNSRKKTSVSVI